MQGFEELRARFIRNSMRRVEEMRTEVERAASDPAQAVELRRNFHGLAGLGTTYGFPRLSLLGRDGEKKLDGVNTLVGENDLRRDLLQIVEEISRELSSDAGATSEADDVRPDAALTPQKPKVIVVADDAALEKILERGLADEGFAVVVVHSKAEVLAEAQRETPSAVIVDVTLRDATGYQVVEELRFVDGGESIVAFVASSDNGFVDKVEAVRCGADGFFEKPLDVQSLVRSLRQLLATRTDEPRRILSVEDDPDQASFLQMVLESAGYIVRICRDPKSFDSDLTAFRPDLVLMDINLPGYSGYELARYVRQNEAYATLPIIFLSTEGQLLRRIESIRAGGDDHLVKPVSPPLLLSTAAARIERARFLQTLVDRDGLTGLLTHTAFLERLKQRFAVRNRTPRAAALVMIDIDHFKRVNDAYGHPVGDRVLASLAALLRRRLRLSDTLGRYGGEEFAILIEDLNGEEATRLVQRLLDEFGAINHRNDEGERFSVTFSAGVAMLNDEMTSIEEWKRAADQMLYQAKENGRNRVVLYVPAATTR